MALPELDIARVQRWCAARVPGHARHQVRVEYQVAATHITVVERRAPRRDDCRAEWTSFPIARLRYTAASKSWTLYSRDRNLRFHLYDRLPPSNSIDDLLKEINRDPTCIFWGQPRAAASRRLTAPLGRARYRPVTVGPVRVDIATVRLASS
jgi:hypothetical protein